VTIDNKNEQHLVAIAGPTCCGKTHFADALQKNISPWLNEFLGLVEPIATHSVNGGNAWQETRDPSSLLVTYSLPLRKLTDGTYRHLREDPRIDTLAAAKPRVVVTLFVDRETVLGRLEQRRRALRQLLLHPRNWRRFLGERERLTYMEDLYRRWTPISDAYRQWLEVVASLNVAESYILHYGSEPELVPMDTWSDDQIGYARAG
jgi:hypothetical protein